MAFPTSVRQMDRHADDIMMTIANHIVWQ